MPMNKPVKPKVMAKPKPRAKVAPVKPTAKVTKPRGSKSQTQVGNDNQRERYNQGRDAERKLVLSNRKYRKDFGGTSASGDGAKVSTAQVKKQNEMKSKVGKKGYYVDKNGTRVYPRANETTTAYNSQRKGGKVGSKNAGKSNPMPRKRFKAPKGA
jgi:hypothetical protein